MARAVSFIPPMGHDLNSMALRRLYHDAGSRHRMGGATGRVTCLPIPSNFPPSDKAVQGSGNEVMRDTGCGMAGTHPWRRPDLV